MELRMNFRDILKGAAVVCVLFAPCAVVADSHTSESEDITPPARDWRLGPPPSKDNELNKQDYADDFFQPPPAELQDLNDNSPPEPPNPHEDEYRPPGGRNAFPPPPGYENLSLPGEPPRR